jgi:hypothetical protein
MDPVLDNSITVNIDGDTYIFRVPSFKDEIALGLRERAIRLAIERETAGPDGAVFGMPTGDNQTDFMVRTAATFDMLLLKGPEWVWSNDTTGHPKANYENWPLDKVSLAAKVGVEFDTQLRRFRDPRTPDGGSVGGKTVAGEPNTADQPVRPADAGPQ